MKTAGVVLDFYDDPTGDVLKRVFSTPDELPAIVKEAHLLTQEERDILRNEAFALVMVNEGHTIRKYACVDAGNTALSALYFLEHHDKLPEEAVKVACANLFDACQEFRLPTDVIEKIAAAHGMSRKRDPMAQSGYVGDEADWAQRTNLLSVRGGADSGRVIPTASTMKTASVFGKPMAIRKAEDAQKKLGIEPTMLPKKATIVKTAGMAREVGVNTVANLIASGIIGAGAYGVGKAVGHREKKAEATQGGMILTDDKRSIGVSAKAPDLQERKPHLSVVDVTGKEPKKTIEKKSYAITALDGRYSLDSYADVQKAVEYFGENWTEMVPEDRHEYAVKTAARAEDLGIEVPDLLARYGSTEYAPDVEAHLANRRSLAPDWKDVYDDLQEKRASIEPEVFAALLAHADEGAGLHAVWGGQVCDPYLSTFGGGITKEAEVWAWQSRTGDYVSADQIRNLAINGRPLIHKHFDSDTTNGFCKDPIPVFESLPDTHKIILARLANDLNDGLAAN